MLKYIYFSKCFHAVLYIALKTHVPLPRFSETFSMWYRNIFETKWQRFHYCCNLWWLQSLYGINTLDYRHKFCEILPLITEFLVDILAIAESKLDDSFPSQQFNISNYKLHRRGRDSRRGGIMIYINDGIPHRMLKDYTGVHMGVEFMTIELSVKSSKWNLCYIYKPPRITDKIFCDFLSELCEVFVTDGTLSLFFGDMNCNLFQRNGVSDICDVFGLTNLVKQPTCFKGDTSTLVDVFLTNRPKLFSGVLTIDIGASDFHNYVCVASRASVGRIFVLILIMYLFMSPTFLMTLTISIGHITHCFYPFWMNMRHKRQNGLKKNKCRIWILSYERRFSNEICGGTDISRTNEIKMRSKIMLD